MRGRRRPDSSYRKPDLDWDSRLISDSGDLLMSLDQIEATFWEGKKEPLGAASSA